MSDEVEEVTAVAVQASKAEAQRLEDDTVEILRENMNESARITKVLLARAEQATGRDLPGALRAVNDVQSKSVDGLLKLTNRAPGGARENSLEELVGTMVDKGYLRLNVQLGAPDGDAPNDSV